jgi:endonuclease-3
MPPPRKTGDAPARKSRNPGVKTSPVNRVPIRPTLMSDVLGRLSRSVPDPRMELDARNPFELLVATVLSAQSTDRRVNALTPALFIRYPDPASMAVARPEDLEDLIRPAGFFRRKAGQLIQLSRVLTSRFQGKVPPRMEDLVTLPGVGRKTASVILAHGFGIPAIPVDTHVMRVSRRLGLTRSDDPEEIEADLKREMDPTDWIAGSARLLLHGRYVCLARKPLCADCVLAEICPSRTT